MPGKNVTRSKNDVNQSTLKGLIRVTAATALVGMNGCGGDFRVGPFSVGGNLGPGVIGLIHPQQQQQPAQTSPPQPQTQAQPGQQSKFINGKVMASLKANEGKRIVIEWSDGEFKAGAFDLEHVDFFRGLEVKKDKVEDVIPFVGETRAIMRVMSSDGDVLYNNAANIPADYAPKNAEEVHNKRVSSFGADVTLMIEQPQ